MLDQRTFEKYARLFPFSVGQQARRCDAADCVGVMETTYVHDKHSQEHYRGVEAWQCTRCNRTVRKDPQEDV